MAWYKAGQVSVTKGSTSVTGVGTRWASNARVGDAFRGPDGFDYEVVNVASETTIGIYPAYQNDSVSGSRNYVIVPIQGYVKDSADQLRRVTDGLADIDQDVEDAQNAASAAQQSEANALVSATNAKNSENAAKASETNAKTSETNAGTSRTQAAASATAASGSATAAKTSETNAKASETAAKTSETNAKASETAANTSRTQAATSATNAANSATAASTSATTAKASEDAAKASQTAAGNSQTAAATSATNSANSATASQTARTGAETARTGAETARTQAQTAETNAKKWATNPEDSAVETGQYSALHWAAKAKASAELATGSQGPRLTSIAAAVMAVNDILIADTTTTMKSMATGANGRLLLGGADAATNRTNLGLGTAAIRDTNDGVYDNPSGSLGNTIMRTGAFGLGSSDLADLTNTDADTVNVTGFYQLANSCTNLPFTGASGKMLVMTNALWWSTQIFSPQDTTGRLYIRGGQKAASTNNAVYGPWQLLQSAADLAKYGIGAAGTSSVTDANTVTLGGEYFVSSTAQNIPIAAAGFIKHQAWADSSAAVQVYTLPSLTLPRQWVRTRTSNSWSQWFETSMGTSSTNETNLNTLRGTKSFGFTSNSVGAIPQTGAYDAVGWQVDAPGQRTQYGTVANGDLWTRTDDSADGNGAFSDWVNITAQAYGVGTAGTPPRLADVDTVAGMVTGLYSIANPTGTLPPVTRYGVMIVERFNNSRVTQTFKSNPGATDDQTIWVRMWNDVDTANPRWTAWQRIAADKDITAWGYNTNIGSTSGAAYCTNIDNFDLANGLYVSDAGTTGTKPAGQTFGTLLVMGRNFTAGRVVQVWNETETGGGGASRSWRRLNYGRSWGPWIQDLSVNDLTSTEFKGTPVTTGTNVARYINEGSTTAPAVLTRLDAANFYLLLTDPSDQRGSFNSLRPFSINLTSGMVSMANGAATASPSGGDRSTRVATTTWVGSELGRFGLGGNAASVSNTTTMESGNYYYAAAVSPYPDYAFVQRLTYGGSNGFEIGNIPYTDRVFLRASNSNGTWRTPVEIAKQSDVDTKEPTITTGTTAQYYRGDKNWVDFAAAVRGAALSGLNTGNNTPITATDSVVIGMGRAQAQINAIVGVNTNITSLRASKYFDPIIVANATGTYTCDLTNSSTWELTLTGNTTLTFSNPPTIPANTLMTVVVTIKQGTTARTLTLPANTKVIATGDSILTPGASKQQDYIFTTRDGTNWEVRAGASN